MSGGTERGGRGTNYIDHDLQGPSPRSWPQPRNDNNDSCSLKQYPMITPPSPLGVTFRALLKTVAAWIDLSYILWVSPQPANFRLASGPLGVEKQISNEAEELAFLFQGPACSSGKNCGPLPNPWAGNSSSSFSCGFRVACVELIVSSSRIPETCFLSSPEHLLSMKPLRDSKLCSRITNTLLHSPCPQETPHWVHWVCGISMRYNYCIKNFYG